MARTSQQPFFLMVNSHDPHRPFDRRTSDHPHEQWAPSSRKITAEDVRLPGFLPDLPGVRHDFAGYCTSTRRLDDLVGHVLDELATAQLAEDTMVLFLSDHGMPFPGAKFNCYPYSVRTPLIIRWPGKTKRGSIDSEHMVAAIDFMPTILQAVELPLPAADGRSFLPLLRGESQTGRDHVFAQFYHIHGGDALPMRAVLGKESAYIFNPWSNGERRFLRLGGATFEAMRMAAETDTAMAARIRHLQARTVEEFYDLCTDPYCLANLLDNGESGNPLQSAQQKKIVDLRSTLRTWMVRVNDPALAAFDKRHQPAALDEFMQTYRERAAREVEALRPYEKAQRYTF